MSKDEDAVKTKKQEAAAPDKARVASCGPLDPDKRGCTTSFLTREKGELDKECGVVPPSPEEEYVQKDEEKESGGEG